MQNNLIHQLLAQGCSWDIDFYHFWPVVTQAEWPEGARERLQVEPCRMLGARLVFVTEHICICFCGERALMQADDRPDLRNSPNQGSTWGCIPLGKDRSL